MSAPQFKSEDERAAWTGFACGLCANGNIMSPMAIARHPEEIAETADVLLEQWRQRSIEIDTPKPYKRPPPTPATGGGRPR